MENKFFILLLFFLLSCNNKIDIGIDVDNLKKEGTSFKLDKINLTNKNEIFLINKVELSSTSDFFDLSSISHNSFNLIKSLNLNFEKSNSKKIKIGNFNKGGFKQILSYQNNIIFLDDRSNLFIVNKELKILKKINTNNDFIKKYPIKYNLLINNNILYVADNLGNVYAYNLISYKKLWFNLLNVPFLSDIKFYKNSIYIVNANGKVFSLAADSGKINWSFEVGSNYIKSKDSFKISLKGDKLIFSNDLGYVYCIDLSKKNILWNYKIQLVNNFNSDNMLKLSNIVVDDMYVYIGSNLGSFVKIDLNTGNILWSKELYTTSNLLVNPNTIVFIDEHNFFVILDKNKGNILFKKNLNKFINSGKNNLNKYKFNNFFLSQDRFYFTNSFGVLFWMSSDNLNLIEQKKISPEINSNLLTIGNNFFFIGNNNYIYKF